MISYALVLALGAAGVNAVTGQLGDAPITQNNPSGAIWQATLPSLNSTTVSGYVSGASNVNGTGVVWTVNLQNLPASDGPYLYHVHEYPVPPNQNCTATGPHLDPEIRGEQPPCDPTQPQTCQVGDLAGKHGNVTSSPFQVFYLDLYQSTIPGTPAYIGNRSIVVHNNQGVRITCANLTMVQSEVVNSTYGISPSSSGASCSAPTQPPTTTIPIPASFTGAAIANRAGSAAALLVGVLLSALL